jgi:hypothetical protein
MPRVVGDRGQDLLELLPPVVRRMPLYMAIMDALGDQLNQLDVALQALFDTMAPTTATDHLDIYEAEVGIVTPRDSTGVPLQSLAARRATVVSFLSRVLGIGGGANWQTMANAFLPGFSYRTHNSADGTSPAPHVINIFLSISAGSAAAEQAQSLIQSITPAVDQINVTFGEGFILDESPMDDDLMG